MKIPDKLDYNDIFTALQNHFDPDKEQGGDAIWIPLHEFIQRQTWQRHRVAEYAIPIYAYGIFMDDSDHSVFAAKSVAAAKALIAAVDKDAVAQVERGEEAQ